MTSNLKKTFPLKKKQRSERSRQSTSGISIMASAIQGRWWTFKSNQPVKLNVNYWLSSKLQYDFFTETWNDVIETMDKRYNPILIKWNKTTIRISLKWTCFNKCTVSTYTPMKHKTSSGWVVIKTNEFLFGGD